MVSSVAVVFTGGGGPGSQSPPRVHSVKLRQQPVLYPASSKQQTGISEGQVWANSPVLQRTSAETNNKKEEEDEVMNKITTSRRGSDEKDIMFCLFFFFPSVFFDIFFF